tara:strand:+ start:103 stop:339 length:237 start_codon:yes stop_codon:yes gene_type:complete
VVIGTPEPTDAVIQLVLVEKVLNALCGVITDHGTSDSSSGQLSEKPCCIRQQANRVPTWMQRLSVVIHMIKHLLSQDQ